MDKLHRLIAPSFIELHSAISEEKYSHYWLKGGRGSSKSTFISLEIVLGVMRNRQANAVVLRKVASTIKDSVYEQVLWAIDRLGVADFWEKKSTPLTLTFKPTGQKILFRGADNPQKIKSLKVSNGYIRYVWYEELDEFSSMSEIRTINQSLLRGGEKFDVFYSYNPPKNIGHWVNSEVQVQSLRKDTFVHHSDFRLVPLNWLGEQFVSEAEALKKSRPEIYRHEYLGEVTGTGGEVFTNLVFKSLTDLEIASFDKVRYGLDWGYGPDPLCFVALQKENERIIIFNEFYKYRAKFSEIADYIRLVNPQNEAVITDSAEPRSNDELRERNVRVLPAKKGSGSVEHGIGWLQNLREIVIDPIRCPNVAREFREYELEKASDGSFKGGFPDRNNHSIDAVRYACERDMKRGGVSFA